MARSGESPDLDNGCPVPGGGMANGTPRIGTPYLITQESILLSRNNQLVECDLVLLTTR